MRALVQGAGRVLAEAGVPSAAHDAHALAAHVLGVDRIEWALAPADAPDGFAEAFAAVVDRRRRREPLQRILGRAAFRHLEVEVADDVFIPRPETEVVAQVAIDEAARLVREGARPLVVDLCSGSGVIGISVDVEVDAASVVAVELSPAAARTTERNARLCGAPTHRTVPGDVRDPGLLAELAGAVDVVVANPPYIPPHAEPLEPEVRDHDPDLALYGGGADGLDVPRAVVVAAGRLLRPGGLLVMEHAEVQAAGARAAVDATGAFTDVRSEVDLTGRERMVVARRATTDGTGATATSDGVKDSRP
nr:peptide chain release factor N(5)-glutamine methyltransferase [Cellulomonas sp. APG4]